MIIKRSVSIRGHPTSISIEDEFWTALKSIAADRGERLATLVSAIDAARAPTRNLSSAIRVFVLSDALARAQARQNSSGGETPGNPS